MPVINGKFYMNPTAGAALERARTAESDAASEDRQGAERQRDSRGRFVPPGRVHRVEIEAADGGFVAHLHRQPPDAQQASSLSGGVPPHPTTHVFSNHQDLVQFLREELGAR